MKLEFFKPTAKALSSGDKKLISTLVRIRTAKNPTPDIDSLTSSDFAKMQALVIKMGEKILKANYAEAKQYNKAKMKFVAAITNLFKHNISFIAASYSSQLLQYYTLICHPSFEPANNTVEFLDFLTATQYENIDSNLLISEYKIIKIYNDLSDLIDCKEGIISTMSTLESQISILFSELNQIQRQVNPCLEEEFDNIFSHYLNFCVHYCFARAVELQFFYLKESSTAEEQVALSYRQQLFLNQAQEDLNNIKKLKESSSAIKGSEFSFGQDVLYRLPISDLEALQSHLNTLTGLE